VEIVVSVGDKLIASAEEKWVRRYDERPSSLLDDIRNGSVEVI
jgi:hypothetical protein